MKKWIPIIIAGLLVLLFRLPTTIIKRHVNKQISGIQLPDVVPISNNIDSEHNNIYYNDEYKFKIYFPEGWEVKPPISPNNDIIIKAIHWSINQEKFSTIIIYAKHKDNTFSFDDLTPSMIYDIYYSKQLQIVSSGIEHINNIKCMWIKFKTKNCIDPDYELSYFFYKNNTLFFLSGKTCYGGDSWYRQNEDLFLKSFRTFQFN